MPESRDTIHLVDDVDVEVPVIEDANGPVVDVTATNARFAALGGRPFCPFPPSSICLVSAPDAEIYYRGYPQRALIEAGYTFLEIAYLLLEGELPDAQALAAFSQQVYQYGYMMGTDSDLARLVPLIESLPSDLHPMQQLGSVIAALESDYDVLNAEQRKREMIRLLGQLPSVIAMIHACANGNAYGDPKWEFGYAGSFLHQMGLIDDGTQHRGAMARALDDMLSVHADLGTQPSTIGVRQAASTRARLCTSIAAGCGVLSGPLHGGANERVLAQLRKIHSEMGGDVHAFITYMKSPEAKQLRLLVEGLGHTTLKPDPRADTILGIARELFQTTGEPHSLFGLALELRQALAADAKFGKIAPNVDFFSGVVFEHLGFESALFTLLFVLGRLPGWMTHYDEQIELGRIVQSEAVYNGHAPRGVPARTA